MTMLKFHGIKACVFDAYGTCSMSIAQRVTLRTHLETDGNHWPNCGA